MIKFRFHLLLLTLLWACGGDTGTDPDAAAETGSVAVTAVTTGADLDTEYGVTIGSQSGTVPANGSVTIANVPVGAANVQLTGVASNCAVTGSASQSVTVAANATVSAAFAVVCEAILDVNALIAEAIASMEEAMFTGLNIDAVSQLDDFSFAESNALFLEVLAASPTNETALFGAAVTGIFLLEDNSRVRAVVEDWDAFLADDPAPSPVATLIGPAVTAIGSPITLPLGFSTGTIKQVAYSGLAAFEFARGPAMVHDPPPSVEELQAVLAEVVLPALLEAEEHLFEITNSSFTFTVTEKMQGELPIDADPLELDYTEILTMQAGVQAALAAIDVSAAYQLTPNPLDDHPQSWVDALEPGSPFLKLATGGEAALGDALERLQSAGTLLLSAIDELEAETDDQTDDIIKIDPLAFDDLTFESAQELADARDVIQDILDALSGPTVITLEEGTIDEFSIMVNAREFFIDPIEDFKAMLPPYEVFTADEDGEEVVVARWTELNIDEWTFPDPTFSGILPEMLTTADLLAQDLDIGEFFFEFALTTGDYTLTTVDGNDCQALILMGELGCPTNTGVAFYSGGLIELGHGDGQPEVFFSLNHNLGNPSWSGSHVVVANPDGTYTLEMTTTKESDSSFRFWTGPFEDKPGFISTDQFGRARGGSSITLLFSGGSSFVFEKQ